jgi:hypothetical protein
VWSGPGPSPSSPLGLLIGLTPDEKAAGGAIGIVGTTVTDDGRGSAASAGAGLAGLAEPVEALGGQLAAGSSGTPASG